MLTMKSDFEAYLRAHIHPVDTSGRYERMLRQTLAGLPEDGLSRVGIRRIGVRRAWRTAVVLAALCALSVGGVAYGLSRGALSFNEDFGWGTPIVSQPGAEAFLVSGALAHASLAHVDVDVL